MWVSAVSGKCGGVGKMTKSKNNTTTTKSYTGPLRSYPWRIGMKEAAILERMGFQSELNLGARSVLFIGGFLVWMAACSVRSR